jgi:hypothetical protein
VLFIPEQPSLIDANQAALWVSSRVNILVSSLMSCVAVVSSLGHFGARNVGLGFWGFLT